jgi:MGT family glycosyltransferase
MVTEDSIAKISEDPLLPSCTDPREPSRAKRIVFFSIPAHGHTNPTLPVVRALVALGHDVIYYSYNMFRDKIEATGARFVSSEALMPELDLNAIAIEKVAADLAYSAKILADVTLATGPRIREQMKELCPDVIVVDSLAYWAKCVARELQIPMVSSTTTFAFNRITGAMLRPPLPGLFRLLLDAPKIRKEIRRLDAGGFGTKDLGSAFLNDDETDTIVYTSKEFQPRAETFSDRIHFIGPSVPARLIPKANHDRKLVYISLGTVVSHRLSFYRNCIAAMRDLPVDVVMSVGSLIKIEDLGAIPENFRVSNFVNQLEVLQQVDVFLSHGGMNSVNESLFYEVPLVLFPQTSEQMGVARRVCELGAGVLLSEKAVRDITGINETVQKVLADDRYRANAAEVAAGFRNCGGAQEGAEAILGAACRRS